MENRYPKVLANRYVLNKPLGAGGMGAVFQATDRLTGQTVALKRVLLSQHSNDHTPTDDRSDARVALSTEFRTLASLRHPNIITVIDYGFDEEQQPYFTMKLLENARNIVMTSRGKPLEEQVALLNAMLQALAYLHRRDIIHRDIKPGNVLVDQDGQVKVLDFGVSINDTRTMANLNDVAVGTLAYMAPELFLDRPASVGSDLYAVGVIAYQMFASRHPYNISNMAALINSVMSTEPDLDVLDVRIAPVVGRLLAKDTDSRYDSADDAIRAFCEALKQPIPIESDAVRESFLQHAQFVGREKELNLMRRALGDVIQASLGSAWLIGGESGVGKSRLVDELRIRALVRGIHVYRGQCVSESGLPYLPWRDPLRRLVLSIRVDDDEAAILQEIIPDIGDLLGRNIPDIDLPDGKEGANQLIDTIVSLFRRQSDPTLLIVEDLQWADESLTVLKRLVENVEQYSLMIVGNYRDDESPNLPEQLPGTVKIKLGRLNDNAIAQLTAAVLGGAGALPQVINLIKRETEGNVFFMVEVMRALAESAGSMNDIGKVTIPQRVFTGGIREIVQRRLNTVPKDAQHMLKLAAIIGRQIDIELLRTMQGSWRTPSSPEIMDVDSWLTICVNVAVLDAEEGKWRFAHDKLREGALNLLEKEEQTHLYRQVAEATEALYSDSKDHIASLAEYWLKAGEPEKALKYTLNAADNARRINAFRETIHYTQQAIELLRIHQPTTDWQHQAADLKIRLGEAYGYLGEFEEAKQHLRESAELSRLLGNRHAIARAFNALGDIDQDQGEYDSANTNHRVSLALFREVNDLRGVTNALIDLGRTAQSQGDYEKARQRYEESLRICRDVDDKEGMVESLESLGSVAERQGEYDDANHYYELSLSVIREIGDYSRIAGMLDNLGNVAEKKGDYPAAQIYYGESLTIYRRISNELGAALVLGNLGNIALAQKNYMTAQAYCEESLDIFHQIDNRLGIAFSLNSLGNVALAQDEPDRARDYYEQALSICRKAQVRGGIASGYGHLGWLAEYERRYVDAADCYEQALDIRREMGDREKVVITLCNLAFTLIQVGDLKNAQINLDEALRTAWHINAQRGALIALLGYAHLDFANEAYRISAELVGLISQEHDLDDQTIERRLQPLLERLQQNMDSNALLQALEHGRTFDLNDMIEQIMNQNRTGT